MERIKRDILKGIAYTVISQMVSVKKGWSEFDKAKFTVDRWVKDCEFDVTEYFKPEIYTKNEDVPDWVGKELATDAWQAFEFFHII